MSRLLIPGLVGAGEEWLVDCAGGGVLLYAFEGGDLVLGPSCCFFGQSLSTCLFCSCFLHILNEMLKSVYFLLRVTSSSLKALILVTTYLLFLFLCLYSQPYAFWLSKIILNLHIKKYTFSNLNNSMTHTHLLIFKFNIIEAKYNELKSENCNTVSVQVPVRIKTEHH